MAPGADVFVNLQHLRIADGLHGRYAQRAAQGRLQGEQHTQGRQQQDGRDQRARNVERAHRQPCR